MKGIFTRTELYWLMLLLSFTQAVPVRNTSYDYTSTTEESYFYSPSTSSFPKQVCLYEGKEYRESEVRPSVDPCELCTCIPPSFTCTTRTCDVKPGCKALQSAGRCCPEYVCDCYKNGRTYGNGEKVEEPNPCNVCYCRGGQIQCTGVTCYTRTDCEPHYVSGKCCPKYDHCPAIVRENRPDPELSSMSNSSVKEVPDFPKENVTRKIPTEITTTTVRTTDTTTTVSPEIPTSTAIIIEISIPVTTPIPEVSTQVSKNSLDVSNRSEVLIGNSQKLPEILLPTTTQEPDRSLHEIVKTDVDSKFNSTDSAVVDKSVGVLDVIEVYSHEKFPILDGNKTEPFNSSDLSIDSSQVIGTENVLYNTNLTGNPANDSTTEVVKKFNWGMGENSTNFAENVFLVENATTVTTNESDINTPNLSDRSQTSSYSRNISDIEFSTSTTPTLETDDRTDLHSLKQFTESSTELFTPASMFLDSTILPSQELDANLGPTALSPSYETAYTENFVDLLYDNLTSDTLNSSLLESTPEYQTTTLPTETTYGENQQQKEIFPIMDFSFPLSTESSMPDFVPITPAEFLVTFPTENETQDNQMIADHPLPLENFTNIASELNAVEQQNISKTDVLDDEFDNSTDIFSTAGYEITEDGDNVTQSDGPREYTLENDGHFPKAETPEKIINQPIETSTSKNIEVTSEESYFSVSLLDNDTSTTNVEETTEQSEIPTEPSTSAYSDVILHTSLVPEVSTHSTPVPENNSTQMNINDYKETSERKVENIEYHLTTEFVTEALPTEITISEDGHSLTSDSWTTENPIVETTQIVEDLINFSHQADKENTSLYPVYNFESTLKITTPSSIETSPTLEETPPPGIFKLSLEEILESSSQSYLEDTTLYSPQSTSSYAEQFEISTLVDKTADFSTKKELTSTPSTDKSDFFLNTTPMTTVSSPNTNIKSENSPLSEEGRGANATRLEEKEGRTLNKTEAKIELDRIYLSPEIITTPIPTEDTPLIKKQENTAATLAEILLKWLQSKKLKTDAKRNQTEAGRKFSEKAPQVVEKKEETGNETPVSLLAALSPELMKIAHEIPKKLTGFTRDSSARSLAITPEIVDQSIEVHKGDIEVLAEALTNNGKVEPGYSPTEEDEEPIHLKYPYTDESLAPVLSMISDQLQFLKVGEEQPIYIHQTPEEEAKLSRNHKGVVVVPNTSPVTVDMVKVVHGKKDRRASTHRLH